VGYFLALRHLLGLGRELGDRLISALELHGRGRQAQPGMGRGQAHASSGTDRFDGVPRVLPSADLRAFAVGFESGYVLGHTVDAQRARGLEPDQVVSIAEQSPIGPARPSMALPRVTNEGVG